MFRLPLILFFGLVLIGNFRIQAQVTWERLDCVSSTRGDPCYGPVMYGGVMQHGCIPFSSGGACITNEQYYDYQFKPCMNTCETEGEGTIDGFFREVDTQIGGDTVNTIINLDLDTLVRGGTAGITGEGSAEDPGVMTAERFENANCLVMETEATLDDFDYFGVRGQDYWYTIPNSFCGYGRKQSPINIDIGLVQVVNADPIKVVVPDSSIPISVEITGDDFIIRSTDIDNMITVSSGPLQSTYNLDHIRIKVGVSEHSLTNKVFDGEIQFYFIHEDHDALEIARTRPNGVVALSVLLETERPDELSSCGVSGTEGILGSILIDLLCEGCEYGHPNLDANLARILSTTNLASYIYYEGSLTFPPCSENVEWFVFPKPVAWCQQYADAFEDDYFLPGKPPSNLLYKSRRRMHFNFRDLIRHSPRITRT